MKTLDEIIARLIGGGFLEEAAVELAEEEQTRLGHSLDTHLLAMGFLEEKAFLRVCAEVLEIQAAFYEEGIDLDVESIKSLGHDAIRKHGLVPIRSKVAGRTLFVTAPLDSEAEELVEEKLGAGVKLFVWPEIRRLQALHNALGDELPEWTRGFFKDNPLRMSIQTGPKTVDVAEALRSSRTLGSDWTVEELESFYEECFDRDTLLKVLLGYAGQWLSNRMVVVRSKVGLQPYFLEDWVGLDPRFEELSELRKIQLDVESEGRALTSEGLTMGRLKDLGLAALFEAIDVPEPPLTVCVPVRIGGRTAMLLIGTPTHRERSMRLDEVSESYDTTLLENAARQAGLQLEELIKRAKAGTLPPRAQRIPKLPQRLLDELEAQKALEEEEAKRAAEAAAAAEASRHEEPSIPERPAHQTQQLWAVDREDGPEGDSAPGQALEDGFDPRQTQRIPNLGQVEEVNAPPSEGIVDETSRTSAGMPPVEIEGLGPDQVAEVGNPGSEVDLGWDSMLNEASIVDKSEVGDELSDEPTSGQTLMGGFSMSSEGYVVELHDAQEEQEALEPEAPPMSDELQEENGPPKEDPLTRPRQDSSPYLPGAQIFKRGRIKKKASSPEVTEGIEGQPQEVSEAQEPQEVKKNDGKTVPLAAVLSPASMSLSERSSPEKNEEFEGEKSAGEVVFEELVRNVETEKIVVDPHAWLDEFKNEVAKSTPDEAPQRATMNTMPLEAAEKKTQSFGLMVQDMAQGVQGPLTIPPEALEELLDSGPIAVDIEESLAMLDSPDRRLARAAAEHIATAKGRALDALESLFPGRLFVDRYQYTVKTMPPVAEHGAVLDTLVRIGAPACTLVKKFLDHQSIELRFYATFLLTELPADGLLSHLYERLYDRDQQTRQIAQRIVKHQRHDPEFEDTILIPLREELTSSQEELRVEVAAQFLGAYRDQASVPDLIDALSEHSGRVRSHIYTALRAITLQPFDLTVSEWRNWWFDACHQPRSMWIVNALNADDEEIRYLVFDEIQQMPGLDLNYHPEQPPKLRVRAERELGDYLGNLSEASLSRK